LVAPSPVDLSFDCEVCHVEGGCLETYDPLVAACRFGVPAVARCRVCLQHAKGVVVGPAAGGAPACAGVADVAANGCPLCAHPLEPAALDARRCPECGAHARLELVQAGKVPASEGELAQALGAWARSDGFDHLADFLAATFVRPELAALLDDLAQGRLIETVPDPFARHGGGATGHAVARSPAPAPRATDEDEIASPSTERDPHPPASAPPRAVVFPLVSVVAADGEIDPRERELVDRFLRSEGLEPLHDDEIRVHRPDEVAHLVPAHRREAVVQLMCETAAIDGAADASEIRVIQAYAAAWGVPADKIDLWIWAHENMGEPFARQFWKKLRRFVLSSRWEQRG
jgi:uncharacterized tellurite resistance protein B-like protein